MHACLLLLLCEIMVEPLSTNQMTVSAGMTTLYPVKEPCPFCGQHYQLAVTPKSTFNVVKVRQVLDGVVQTNTLFGQKTNWLSTNIVAATRVQPGGTPPPLPGGSSQTSITTNRPSR